MDYRQEFIESFRRDVQRPGAEKLLEWLDTTDFFTAPASTRFHGACESGLVLHSLNVYKCMMSRWLDPETDSLRFYRLGNQYKTKVEHIGRAPQWPQDEVLLV